MWPNQDITCASIVPEAVVTGESILENPEAPWLAKHYFYSYGSAQLSEITSFEFL
jgi:hypothetical protein